MTTTDLADARVGLLATALAGINGFVRATAGDLPEPRSISVYGFSGSVAIHFTSLDDLCEWAAYLQVPVTGRDVRPQYDAIHHNADATWGPVNGQMVEFSMVFIEDIPQPSTETYECTSCGAAFGITGASTGSPEDDAADEFFREELERHESGACVADGSVTA